MFPSPVAVVLTVVFAGTGVIAVLALARRVGAARATAAGPGPCGDTRATELLHLLMSIAMIAMAWGWSGGPGTVAGLLQVVVFGGVAAVLGALGAAGLLGGRRDRRGARLSHGLAAAAMAWMVAAMPLLMHAGGAAASPATAAPASHAGHGAGSMGSMGSMPPPAPAATTLPASAGWVSAVSTALVALLVVVGVAWTVRAVQLGSPAHRALTVPAPRPVVEPAPDRVAVAARGGGPSAAVTTATAPAAVPTATPSVPVAPAILAASCHALMGLGTAAMLAAML